jgi:hypothetical protein
MSQIVRFRRPDAPECVCSMVVGDDDSAAPHIRRVESLGYTVVDVLPPPAELPPMRPEFPR